MNVKLDQDKCTGCGICAKTCPDGIEMKNEKASIINENAPCLKEAAEVCPINIINFNEENAIEDQTKSQDINTKSESVKFGRGQGGQGRGMGLGRGRGQGKGMGLGRRS